MKTFQSTGSLHSANEMVRVLVNRSNAHCALPVITPRTLQQTFFGRAGFARTTKEIGQRVLGSTEAVDQPHLHGCKLRMTNQLVCVMYIKFRRLYGPPRAGVI